MIEIKQLAKKFKVENPFQACNDVFFRPGSVFEALKQHNNWSWLPFVIVVVMAILPNYLYFTTVDPVWYVEHLLANSPDFADLSPAELDGMRDLIPVESMGTWGALGGLVGLTIINAIIAVYFKPQWLHRLVWRYLVDGHAGSDWLFDFHCHDFIK